MNEIFGIILSFAELVTIPQQDVISTISVHGMTCHQFP